MPLPMVRNTIVYALDRLTGVRINHAVEVVVDTDKIARELFGRAVRSKKGRATALAGAVEVRVHNQRRDDFLPGGRLEDFE